MKESDFTQEPYSPPSFYLRSQATAKDRATPEPPVIVIVVQEGDASVVALFLQQVSRLRGAVILVMECGEPGGASRVEAELRPAAAMPVVTAGPATPLVADQVLIIPPGITAQLVKGRLAFRAGVNLVKDDAAAEMLLSTVAAIAPNRHLAVVTPGLPARLAAGLRVTKAEGGFTFMLTEQDPHFFSREETAGIDFILSPAEAGWKIPTLFNRLGEKQETKPALADGAKEVFHTIFLQLFRQNGIDLSVYPLVEVLRRMRRRMMIHQVATLRAYASILNEEVSEGTLLCEELETALGGSIIEPSTEFALFNEVLPRMLEGRTGSAPLRVWVPRCASGPQVYSLAVSLYEYLAERKAGIGIQIFATDLNKAAIDRARAGTYTPDEIQTVSAQKRKKYFSKRDDRYLVCQPIREMCVFSTHNLLKDPPFSHIDVIIGAVTLVGLSATSRDQVFKHFHYALNSNGYLLPGKMRVRSFPEGLFQLVQDNPYILRRKDGSTAFNLLPQVQEDKHGEKEASRLLLSGYVPAAILVDEQCRVIRFYGDTEPYLRMMQDRISLHLFRVVRDELMFELDELFEKSEKSGGPASKDGVEMVAGTATRSVSLEVVPLQSLGQQWKMVVIRESLPKQVEVGSRRPPSRPLTSKDLRIRALEKELHEMRGLLLAANEDASSVQKALQDANEEIMASNEELQSINEQLQSVNSELLSYNLELNTVNEELYVRNNELEISTAYANAIVSCQRRPLAVLQDDLMIRTANPSFTELLGIAVEEVAGRPVFEVGGGVLDRMEFRQAVRHMRSNDFPSADVEIRVELPDGGERIWAIAISGMKPVKSMAPGMVLSIEDITERRKMERYKDEFIGVASHELKTPATSIQAYSQLLYAELADTRDPDSAELVKKLNGQVTRLTRLTKDLLDITRIGQGQLDLKKGRFDLDTVIGEIVDEVQVTTAIRLVVEEHARLPLINGDAERIAQVLLNLLSNAVKYAPGSVEILIRPAADNGRITVSILDFGIGMAADSLQRIFDRFYRLDESSTPRNPGVGLGLYISSEIVRRHGGDLLVSSEKGKGSVFTIILPID